MINFLLFLLFSIEVSVVCMHLEGIRKEITVHNEISMDLIDLVKETKK